MVVIKLSRGLDLALGTTPAELRRSQPTQVALLGSDHPGLQAQLRVEEGATVAAGAAIFSDRRYPDVISPAPCDGTIRAINWNSARELHSVVIDRHVNALDTASNFKPMHEAAMRTGPKKGADAEAVRLVLAQSGLWNALRMRPGDRVLPADQQPAELFVTALETQPLAPNPAPLINRRSEDFVAGLRVLAQLTPQLYVCGSADVSLPVPTVANLTAVQVAGPHPAGLAGTLIHAVARARRKPWIRPGVCHIGYQDVLAIGALWNTGVVDYRRTVSVAGPACTHPYLLETLTGAALESVLQDSVPNAANSGSARPSNANIPRLICGPVLSGRLTTATDRFLGRYDNQAVLLPAVEPAADSAARPNPGMLATGGFDRVWPFEVAPAPLLRALLLRDAETALALGADMLAAEDLALCSWQCPAQKDYGGALQATFYNQAQGAGSL